MFNGWQLVENASEIDSPALLFYPERIAESIRRTLKMVRDPQRLRPHIKTHKCPQIVRMQLDAGITKFKCATIAEAEMLAQAKAPDVLLAYQPAGPRAGRFVRLIETYPHTRFSCIVDDERVIREMSALAQGAAGPFTVLLDVDCGHGRTGIAQGPQIG